MKIVPNFSTAMHNLNPANWDRSTKQKVLYAGAVSVVALTGLVALSNLPTAQALPEASTGICKLPAAWR